jgi:hypothetical protein
MEGHLPYTRGTIQTNSHVLWAYQLTVHLSNNNEYHIPKRSLTGMAFGLYERHRYPHKETTKQNRRTTPTKAPTAHPPSLGQIGRTQFVPQTREV